MPKLRMFIAAQLDHCALLPLIAIQNELKKLVPGNVLKFTPGRQLHVTLVFLGDVDSKQLPRLKQALESSEFLNPFEISIDTFDAFKRQGLPTIYWAGFNPPPSLVKYHSGLVNSLKTFLPIQNQRFTPHITLARVKGNLSADELKLLDDYTKVANGHLKQQSLISEIVLFRSDLSPAGPTYSNLYAITAK